jgi:hypothetical protein
MRIGASLRFEEAQDKREGWDEIAGKFEAAVKGGLSFQQDLS